MNKKAKKIVSFVAAFALVVTTLGMSVPAFSQASAATKIITGVDPGAAQVAVDWNVRYHYSDLEQQLQDLNAAFPEFSELESIGKTYEDRDMWCMTITDESVPKDVKTEVTVFGNIHGGEGESAACAMYSAWYLLENSSHPQVSDLLKKYIVYVIPLINPDGYEQSFIYRTRENMDKENAPDRDGDGIKFNDTYEDINGDGMVGTVYALNTETGRTTGTIGGESKDGNHNGLLGDDPKNSGIDLNRNFDYLWGQDGVMDTEGPSAASELETQAVQNFIDTHKDMKGLITLHTGIQTTLYPWCYRDVDANDEFDFADNQFMKETAVAMSKAMAQSTKRNFYAKQSFHDYQTFSEMIDYSYGLYGIHSYTIEVYNGGTYNRNGMTSEYDENFEVYDPNGDDSIVPNLCKWNNTLPTTVTKDYSHEAAVALFEANGIDPSIIQKKSGWGASATVAPWGEDEGIRISYSSTQQMCGKAPEGQDEMVTGVMKGILVMMESEDPTAGAADALEAATADIIAANETLASGQYTAESFAALKDAIDALNAMYDDPYAKTADINAARATLVAAWRSLEPVDQAAAAEAADLSDAIDALLQELIDVYALNLKAYKAAGVEALNAVVADAETVLTDENSTAAQLKSAKTAILKAVKALEKKDAQALTVKANKKTVKFAKVKKAKQVVKGAITVKGAKGKVTYAKAGGSAKLTIAKTGKITVKKGTKKGTYSIKVKVKAAATDDYTAAAKTVTVKIVVK